MEKPATPLKTPPCLTNVRNLFFFSVGGSADISFEEMNNDSVPTVILENNLGSLSRRPSKTLKTPAESEMTIFCSKYRKMPGKMADRNNQPVHRETGPPEESSAEKYYKSV
ncbi:hypothetical protein NPIL_506241 [Nephila pilipes]|uniref:Uncharacterized protein n=1 Tax=Nephila pilipes TaxID=299642 RepID=A0A8X6KE65_NEPPI|nr:hypothetical protein NPIL_506241 [Nephila pilipes]